MIKSLKESVLKLRSDGLSVKQIADALKCNISTVKKHLLINGSRTAKLSTAKWKSKMHPTYIKLMNFVKERTTSKPKIYSKRTKNKMLHNRITSFMRGPGETTYTLKRIKLKDVLAKFGENPKCYLTGDSVDLNNPSTFVFDHILPHAQGGPATLENLGLATPIANMSKTDLTVEEYLELCAKVLRNFGYKVTKDIDKLENQATFPNEADAA